MNNKYINSNFVKLIVAIIGCGIILLPYLLTEEKVSYQGKGRRIISYNDSSKVQLFGRDINCAEEIITEKLIEYWKVDADTLLQVGDAGTLDVQCKIQLIKLHICDEDTIMHEIITPDKISVGIPLSVEGSFWSEITTKNTSKDDQNPLQWKWSYTPSSEGQKKILITLPRWSDFISDKTIGSIAQKISLNEEELISDSSKYLEIEIIAQSRSSLLGLPSWIINFLGWLIGSGLTIPYIISQFSSWHKRKSAKSK